MKVINHKYAQTFAAMLFHCPKCDSAQIMMVSLIATNKAFRNASTVAQCDSCNSFFLTEKKPEASTHTIVEEVEVTNAN